MSEEIINTDRLRDLPRADLEPEDEEAAGLAVGKKKRKKPKPKPKPPKPPRPPSPPQPGPGHPFQRVFLYVHPAELGVVPIPAGVTDIISTVPSFGHFVWGAGTDADLKTAAAAMVAKAAGKPVWFFFHTEGNHVIGETPWACNAGQRSRFMAHMKAWAQTGIAGFLYDLEDEGQITRRDPATGNVTVPWWPAGGYAAQFARDMAAACAPKPLDAYAIGYLLTRLTAPPIVTAPGAFAFCRALPAGYRLMMGDTYNAGDDTSPPGVRTRWLGSGTYQFGQPKLVMGTWVQRGSESDLARRLGFVARARREASHREYWFYTDPGQLAQATVQQQIEKALR